MTYGTIKCSAVNAAKIVDVIIHQVLDTIDREEVADGENKMDTERRSLPLLCVCSPPMLWNLPQLSLTISSISDDLPAPKLNLKQIRPLGGKYESLKSHPVSVMPRRSKN